ncbi:izumo sperm-egg fusion protein 1-like [Colius striatus]|uniref:izumo sperm-egg fusion protein 1-like n=1 Tax=Colius striatus TaxID=57412 RepID=UPI002B1D54C8|nr:izumo sperm-egg fusion protein 1-like [Colius striatus]
MEVMWIECSSCNVTLYVCSRTVHCGERRLWVEEGKELRLDCGLAWHELAHGTKSYWFYRLRGHTEGPPQPEEQLQAESSEPVLVQKGVTAAAGGRYRCEMRDARGDVASELFFDVVALTPLCVLSPRSCLQ